MPVKIEEKDNLPTIKISLKKCLLSICASSPDIICKDHDLSVYTVNFEESNTKDEPFIWEGHGLLSWIVNQQVVVNGRPSDSDESAIELFIDLQPTSKWEMDSFFSALATESIEQIKLCSTTPSQTSCNCYSHHLLQPSMQRSFETEKKTTEPLPSLPPLSSVPGFRTDSYIPHNKSLYQQLKENDVSFLSIASNIKRPSFTPLSDRVTPSSSCSPETIKDTEITFAKKRHSSSDISQSNKQLKITPRTYYEVKKDERGDYILPAEVDSWTVVDLGTVVYDRPAYHNQRYIYPVNYTVRKWYRSMVDPKSDTQYTCRILDNGNEPKFEVTSDDCPVVYSGPTPTTVWTIIVRRAFAIRDQEYGHNPVGPDFFGLRKSTISKMIQDLPNAHKCSQYTWQVFEPAKFNKPGRNRQKAAINALGDAHHDNSRLMNNISTQYASSCTACQS